MILYFIVINYLNPNSDINWMKICHRLKNPELGFIQYEHKRYYEGIKKDLDMIVSNNTEDEKVIKKAECYLKNINKKIYH